MVMGALGGALMMKFLPAGTSAPVIILLVTLASMLLGLLYSLLLAVAAINFKADQTLVGTAMNLLGTAAATVFVKAMNTAESVDNVSSTIQYIEPKKAFIVNIAGFEFNWFMVLAFAALVISYVTLYKTRFGRHIYACGGNAQAAKWSGINADKIKVLVFVIAGFLNGFAAIVLAGRLGGGLPSAGDGSEMDVITAVVLGGTSMTGGKGKLWGVVLGVLIIGVLTVGLTMVGVSTYWQNVIKGVIIVAAVIIDTKGTKTA